MQNNNERQKGAVKAEEIGGKIKKTVGAVVGNEQMQAEGAPPARSPDRPKQEAAKAAERTKGKVEEIAGKVKNRVGEDHRRRRDGHRGQGRRKSPAASGRKPTRTGAERDDERNE